MAHPRKLIRQAVAALLVSADTAAGDRVTATRVEPHRSTELPAISVYTLTEVIDREASIATAPRELSRVLTLQIRGWVSHSDNDPVDDRMDDLAEEIEAAMDLDRYISDSATDAILVNTETEILEGVGANDPLIGMVTLTYSVSYLSSLADGTAADDFLTAAATYQRDGAAADNTVADVFDVRPEEEP